MSDVVTPIAVGRVGAALHRAVKYTNYAMEMIIPLLPRFSFGSGSDQTVVDGLTVRCDRSIPEDPATIAAWEALYQRTPTATPFHSPAWQQSLLETPQAMMRLRLFTV